MVIEFPSKFIASSLHSIWTDLGSLRSNEDTSVEEVLLDLANIIFVDVEGCNYLALIPALLKEHAMSVQIALPKNESVIAFMGIMGLLEHYEEHYEVLGRTRKHASRYARTYEIFGKQERLLSRTMQSHVFDTSSASSVFRLDLISNQIFTFDSSAAQGCCAALFELISNIFDHSGETTGCVTFQLRRPRRRKTKESRNQLSVAVSDLGIGIKRSIEEQYVAAFGAAATRRKEAAFLEYALMPGVSRTGARLRGRGLPTVVKLASTVQLASGNASVRVDGRTGRLKARRTGFIPGTSAFLVFDMPDKRRSD